MQQQHTGGPLARLASRLTFVENLCAVVAGVALMVAVLLVAANAVSRHVMAAPIEFQLEFTQSYLLVILITLALPWGFRQGGFIRITLLSELMSKQLWQQIYRVGLIASSIYMVLLGYEASTMFMDAWINNHMIMGVIDWPVAWSWIWIPIGCWLLALRLFLMAMGVGEQPEGH